MTTRYEGTGTTIEAALRAAHAKLPAPAPGRDFTTSIVMTWGMQRGGFADATLIYVVVEDDPSADFRS